MTKLGIIVTAIYSFGIIFLRFDSLHKLQELPLNELGDFLAGVFGPLMLFWLILGYLQQQKELRQNTKALELQAKELKNSVEQQKELVIITREQVNSYQQSFGLEEKRANREAEPRFTIGYAGQFQRSSGKISLRIEIVNSGQPAANVELSTNPPISSINSAPKKPYLKSGDLIEAKWIAVDEKEIPKILELFVNCIDGNGSPYSKTFHLELLEGNKYQVVD